MTQGFIAGCTNYQEQTLEDIREDIEWWIKYSKQTQIDFLETIEFLKAANYWCECVPFDFRIFCESVPNVCGTIINDLNIVIKDIDENEISSGTIKLMNNVCKIASTNEKRSWETYKNDSRWKNYDDQNFRSAETLYAAGRDFFVTLIDVGNAVARMEDYMKPNKSIDNSIHIGDGNKIKKSIIGHNNGKEKKEGVITNIIWKFVVPIIVGVAITALCVWFGWKNWA